MKGHFQEWPFFIAELLERAPSEMIPPTGWPDINID